MWTGEMDCNRFSGPTCPLKFRDAYQSRSIVLLSPPSSLAHANPNRNPSISTAYLSAFGRGKNTRIRANLRSSRRCFSHSFPRFDWLRTSRELSGYCSFCTGPFWRIKGTLLSHSTLHPISFLLQSSLLSVVHSICFPCWKMYIYPLACAQYCL